MQTNNNMSHGIAFISQYYKNHKVKLITISLVIIAVAITLIIGYRGIVTRNTQNGATTPEEKLKMLESTSGPVKPVEERAKDLQNLSKTSAPVKETVEQRLARLQKLSQQ